MAAPLPSFTEWLAAQGLTPDDVVVSQHSSETEGLSIGEWRWRYLDWSGVAPERVSLSRFARGFHRFLRTRQTRQPGDG